MKRLITAQFGLMAALMMAAGPVRAFAAEETDKAETTEKADKKEREEREEAEE